jgi:UDP-N-acetylmuramate dehydrogenase
MNNVLYNVNLAKYSYFQVGGNAEMFFEPKNLKELQFFLKKSDNISITIIGGGSNLLIRDNGIKGVVIFLKNTFKKIEINDNFLEVESGVLNFQIYNFMKENNIGGYEFLGTIPGTIGGAARGNAGCNGSEIKDLVIEIEAIDFNGNIKIFSNSDCNFDYRKNNLPNDLIFTKIKLKINNKKTKEEIEKEYNEILKKRKNSQPFGIKTCGSTFKNPKEKPAWKVVQELGFQGKEINGVKMSEKHANFMVNIATNKAKNLEELGNLIIKEAKEKLNIDLEWEIKIIGENN